MSLSQHVREVVLSRLRDRRILVWYDSERVFNSLYASLAGEPIVCVDASDSILRARQQADRAWRSLFDTESIDSQPLPILIYLPAQRGATEDARRNDLFEPFALAGGAFGATESERLPSIARQVLVGREADVDQLFSDGTPTLAQLDALAGGTKYPLLLEAVGTDVAGRVVAKMLCEPSTIGAHLKSTPALLPELRRLLEDAYGLHGEGEVPFEALGPLVAQWVLFSEFVFDLPGRVPDSALHAPRADPGYERAIYELCQDLRSSSDSQETYRAIAAEVERQLGMSALGNSAGAYGKRDTFPFEDRAALLTLQELALAGDFMAARKLADERRASVWRGLPERDQLWRLAERCLELLRAGTAWEACQVAAERSVAEHVEAYCSDDAGMWCVDQAQRLVEQAAALLVDRDSLSPLLDHVRREYRRWLGDAQAAFLSAVARSGWPAEGIPRQTQAWALHGAGPVRDGRRTAWFLVDAMRFEMGKELARGLGSEGTVRVEPACGVVPAATLFGMAALLPGADPGLTYREHAGALVPEVAGERVATADDRRGVFRRAFGDRFKSIRLGELLTASTAQLREQIGAADVLAVFSTEIDDFGEHSDPLVARRYISQVVADLLAASDRLVQAGFERLVFASDHGFIQLPEVLPGDRCPEPAGQWVLRKRRALLGSLGSRGDQVFSIGAGSLGIQGPVDQVCVPLGVKVFRAASPYFHEGLSLQECVIPFVVLDAVGRQAIEDADSRVVVRYRSDRFTTRIFSVQIEYWSVRTSELEVRVQAFAPGTRQVVGEAADCDARDPHTGIVTLPAHETVQVPIALEPDFDGEALDVRVLDARTPGRSHGSLVLRNGMLD